MRKAIYTKEGRANFLKQYRYILCDQRLKHQMGFVFGKDTLARGRVIPVAIKDVPIETVIKNIRLLLRSYYVSISRCMYFQKSCLLFDRDCRIGNTLMENDKIIANYNCVRIKMEFF